MVGLLSRQVVSGTLLNAIFDICSVIGTTKTLMRDNFPLETWREDGYCSMFHPIGTSWGSLGFEGGNFLDGLDVDVNDGDGNTLPVQKSKHV